jgi:O-antigen/teichoic acid export membrane protein
LTWTASGVVRSRAGQVARNACAGIGSRLGMMAVGFALTPYIVHHLGLRLFGLWSLTGAVAAYLGLLDFGLAGVFVKFVAEYVESGRPDLVRQVMTFGALFYAAFGLVLALPVVLLAPHAAATLGLPAGELHTAVWVFEALALQLVLSLVAGLPGTVVIGMQRMEVASRNGALAYLLSAMVTVALLHAGWGIEALVIAAYAQLGAGATLQYVSAHRVFGPIWHNPLTCDRAVLRRMFLFGGWTQITQLLSIAALDAGRFIAAASLGIAVVGLYELGGRLAYLTRSLPGYFLDAIMPAAAAADVRAGDDDLDRMYVSGTMYTLFASCGMAGFFGGAGSLIVRVWMGVPYPAVSIVVVGLCAGHAFAALTSPGMTILRATGKPRYEAYAAAVTLCVNLICTLILSRTYGLAGIVAGTAVGWLAGSILFTLAYHRVRPSAWWKPVGGPALKLGACSLAAGLPLWFAVHASEVQGFLDGRFRSALALLVLGSVYAGTYAGLSWATGVWRADPSGLLSRLVRRGRMVSAGLAR